MNRRAFLSGLIATPAIVAASSLMPIRGIVMPVRNFSFYYPTRFDAMQRDFIELLNPTSITGHIPGKGTVIFTRLRTPSSDIQAS